jgi:hypothetical protein
MIPTYPYLDRRSVVLLGCVGSLISTLQKNQKIESTTNLFVKVIIVLLEGKKVKKSSRVIVSSRNRSEERVECHCAC